jgi:cold shock CspA family protein
MTAMRFEGKLTKWNSERGFGFIAASDSGQDVFVHISAFPRDGSQPVVDELLSFEVEPDGKGKKRAVRVRRAGSSASTRAPSPRRAAVRLSRAPKSASPMGKLIVVALLAAMGWYGYSHYATRLASLGAHARRRSMRPCHCAFCRVSSKLPVPADFSCDGRRYLQPDEVVPGGHALSAELPRHGDGRQSRRRALRATVVQVNAGCLRGRVLRLIGI